MGIDPIAEKFYDISTYQFAHNNPVWKIELEGLEGMPFQNAVIADAVQNQNGVSAHAVGFAIGVGNTLRGLYDALTSSAGVKAVRDMAVVSAAITSTLNGPGSVSYAMQADSMLGTNSVGALYSQATMFDNLVNGNGLERGESIGEIITTITVGEGVGAVTSNIVRAAKASSTTNVFRVYGGDAAAEGFSWTTENPASVGNFRDAAGLPSGGASGSTNTGQFVIEGTVNTSDIIKSRPALPLDGNVGGLPELIIDPKNVNINRVSGANPSF